MLGAIPYQPNEAVLHTDASLMPRRRAAWSSWNFHLAEPAPLAHHRHLLDEPPAATARAAAVLPHPEPGRGDRPEQGPAQLRLRPSGLHRRGGRRAATPRRGQRGEPHPLLRRLLGMGLPRGWCGERAEGVRGAGSGDVGPRRRAGTPRPAPGRAPRPPPRRWSPTPTRRRWRRERVGDLRGLGQAPALRAGRALLPLPLLPRLPRPRRAARGARPVPALLGPPARPRPLPPLRLPR